MITRLKTLRRRDCVLFLLLALLFPLGACQTFHRAGQQGVTDNDPNLWLEEVESPKALDKVRSWNEPTLHELTGDPRYKQIESDLRKIVLAKDRIPYGHHFGGYVYNFWQDDKNVRGLWRRATLAEYAKKSPKWETLLDLDALAKSENENWVWKGSQCLPPAFDHCLLTLSRGGKDASVHREYSLKDKAFVKGGFELPEAKSIIGWIDQDSVFVSTDFGPGSLSKAGYSRQVRLWKRGQKLEDAKLILEAKPDDLMAYGMVHHAPDATYKFVAREISFTNAERFLLGDDGSLAKLPVPDDFISGDIFAGHLVGILRTDLGTFKAGSAIAYDLKDLKAPPQLVYAPADREAIESIEAAKDFLAMSINRNVKGRLERVTFDGKAWKMEKVALPEDGELALASADKYSDVLLANYASFLTPDSVYEITGPANAKPHIHKIKSLPARFNAKNLTSEQLEATSKDGTKIPYFVVRPKKMKYDGKNATMLYGYGGFSSSMQPFYMGAMGKVLSEKGGVFVLANIRGGGEFGPKWHEAAILKNRQKAYDDFIAVAEDLIHRGITSPKYLAARGGSNGGLLMGVMYTQRPDLFGAIICEVPLLDMLRYHKLLAGYLWTAEYGSVDDPETAPALRAYSPYQNVKADGKYPRIFLLTSTKDDRVHPGHARKMAARLEEMKHPFLYYENIEGGHGAAANLEERIKFSALEFTYFWRQLGTDQALPR